MSAAPVKSLGTGADTSTSAAIAVSGLSGTVAAGNRVLLAVDAAQNRKATGATSSGTTWTLLGFKAANSSTGCVAMLLSAPYASTQAVGVVSVALDGSTNIKGWVAWEWSGIPSGVALDQLIQDNMGVTGTLVNTLTLGPTATTEMDDEAVSAAVFLDGTYTSGALTIPSGWTLAGVESISAKTLILLHKVQSVQATQTMALSWSGAATRSSGVLVTLVGTYNAPAALPNPNRSHALWGIGLADDSDIPTFETAMGRGFAALRANSPTDSIDHPSFEGANVNQGFIVGWRNGRNFQYQNGHPTTPLQNGDTTSSGTFWRSIVAGFYDAQFEAFWDQIMSPRQSPHLWSTGNPFHYSWAHEQSNASNTEPNGPGAGTPADFKAAHRYVYQALVSGGYHAKVGGKIDVCFVPHWSQFAADAVYGPRDASGNLIFSLANAGYEFSNIDPGAAYYELLGADVYLADVTNATADQQWLPVHQACVDRRKPMIIPECGVAAGKGDAAAVAYLKRMQQLLRSFGAGDAPGHLRALMWTSRVASGGDYRLNSTPAIQAQYKRMAKSAYWGGATRWGAADSNGIMGSGGSDATQTTLTDPAVQSYDPVTSGAVA